MADFTPTQARYLSYIRAYTDGFGLPPAEAEIAEALRVAPPSVHNMLKRLESKGFIRRQPEVSRSIEILIDRNLIPPWDGGPISRVETGWFPSRSTSRQIAALLADYTFLGRRNVAPEALSDDLADDSAADVG